jgi:hypothetical protein
LCASGFAGTDASSDASACAVTYVGADSSPSDCASGVPSDCAMGVPGDFATGVQVVVLVLVLVLMLVLSW